MKHPCTGSGIDMKFLTPAHAPLLRLAPMHFWTTNHFKHRGTYEPLHTPNFHLLCLPAFPLQTSAKHRTLLLKIVLNPRPCAVLLHLSGHKVDMTFSD